MYIFLYFEISGATGGGVQVFREGGSKYFGRGGQVFQKGSIYFSTLLKN